MRSIKIQSSIHISPVSFNDFARCIHEPMKTITMKENDLQWLDKKLREEFDGAEWYQLNEIVERAVRLGRTELVRQMKQDMK